MRMLSYRFDVPGIPAIQSSLPLVRGEINPHAGHIAAPAVGDKRETAKSVSGLVAVRTRGIRIAPNGKTTSQHIADWPGQCYGVRKPEIGETPLSNAEWPYLLKGEIE